MWEKVIGKVLSALGWQKLLAMVFKAVLPSLKAAAKKTETQFDDGIVELLEEVVSVIVSDEKAA